MTTITRAQMIERYQLTENYIKKHGAKLGEIPGTRPRIYVQEIAEARIKELAGMHHESSPIAISFQPDLRHLANVVPMPISGRGGRRK